ncbi:MAG: acyl dehydratase [Acidimicrobiales bacterium]
MIEVGSAREQVVIEGITRTHLVKYAGASGDFNPLHHDEAYAKDHGYPGVFGHGMFTMGLTAKVVTDWFGPASVRSYGVRFTRQVWPGDTLTARAVVTSIDGAEVTLSVETTNQKGETVVAGDATVTIPS